MSEWDGDDGVLDYEVSSTEGTIGDKIETPAKSTTTSTASTAETVLAKQHRPRLGLDEENDDEKKREGDNSSSASSSGDQSNVLAECKVELEKLLLEWQEENRKVRLPTLAYQEACALPADDPQKDVKVEAASKAVKRAHDSVAYAKSYYESQKDLYNTMLAQMTPAPLARAASPATPALETLNQSTATLNSMKEHALRTELVRNVASMFSNGLRMQLSDNRRVWVYAMMQYHQANPSISVEVITQAVLQSQISRDFLGDETPQGEAMKDFSLFMDHMLGRQTAKERWENQLALDRLWMGLHQVVGMRHRGAAPYDYAEKMSAFIRRVKRLAEILYPPSHVEQSKRDAAVVRTVIQGLDSRWRDNFFTAATRVHAGFPETKKLTLDELTRLGNTVDLSRDLSGSKTITFELLPSSQYKAEVGGTRFYVPIFPGPRQEAGGGLGSSSSYNKPDQEKHRGGSGSSSSHNKQPSSPTSVQRDKNLVPKKDGEYNWEERQKEFCTFCAKQTPPQKHTKGECPNRDPKTGRVIREGEEKKEGGDVKRHRAK